MFAVVERQQTRIGTVHKGEATISYTKTSRAFRIFTNFVRNCSNKCQEVVIAFSYHDQLAMVAEAIDKDQKETILKEKDQEKVSIRYQNLNI